MKCANSESNALEAAAAGNPAALTNLIKPGKEEKSAKDKHEDHTTLLRAAAANGNVQDVQNLSDEIARNGNGISALKEAAQNGRVEVVKYLIEEKNVDANSKNDVGVTALIAAAGEGHTEAVRYLVGQGGADVDATNENGSTALICAADYGHIDVVRYLAQEGGANVNVTNNNGDTALSKAVRGGDKEIVKFLAGECGADVDITTRDGGSAIRIAADRGDHEMLWLLTRYSKLSLSSASNTPEATDILTIPPSEMALSSFVTSINVGGEYLAKWLDADVVVKLFIPGAASSSFEDEGRVWQQLRHPNVIKMYGACYAGVSGLRFFVCEYASGGSLLEYVRSNHNDKGQVLWKLLHEAALGLEYLHERRIVHGDVRCCNILIGSDDLSKLSNFRLSSSLSSGPTQWQAPEVVDGNPPSFASDIYSLGMSMLEAMTGETPWYGAYDAWMFTKKNQWEPEMQTDESERHAPECPPGPARELVWRMCCKDPNKRLRMSSVVSELERFAMSERSEPENEPKETSFNNYKLGLAQQRWANITQVMKKCENTQHLEAFNELKKVHDNLTTSVQAPPVLAQFDALVADFEAAISMTADQSLAMRLSSTKVASHSMSAFYRRIGSLWSTMGNFTEAASKVQTRAEQQRRDAFVSGVSDLNVRLDYLTSDEEKQAFLATIKAELAKNQPKYTEDQVDMLQNITKAIESTMDDANVSGALPEWFIPWYELVIDEADRLGAGGFGSVYRAKWLDSEVVVKRLGVYDSSDSSSSFTSWTISLVDSIATTNPANSSRKARDFAMFRREVDIWFTFKHPHVIQLFGACHVGNPFFVCEYATNGTLVSYLKHNPDELWEKLYEAALGVQYLHARNVVHGDLKGNNIVIGSDKKAKVTDFGLSSLIDEVDTVGVSGASHWVAPESFEAGARPTFESDIYSLGMCVVEALRVVEAVKAGKDTYLSLPWGALDNAVVRVLARKGRLPERPQISTDNQWDFVNRMCAFEPSTRVKISTVVDELERLMHTQVHAKPGSVQLKPITQVIESARKKIGMLPDDRGDFKLYVNLWDRIERVLEQVDGKQTPDSRETFGVLVHDAFVATMKLSSANQNIISVADTTIQYYALNRRLDKFLEATTLTRKF